MKPETLSVTGMSCDGCERNVENALDAIDGASRVEADHEGNAVEIVGTGSKSRPTSFRRVTLLLVNGLTVRKTRAALLLLLRRGKRERCGREVSDSRRPEDVRTEGRKRQESDGQ